MVSPHRSTLYAVGLATLTLLALAAPTNASSTNGDKSPDTSGCINVDVMHFGYGLLTFYPAADDAIGIGVTTGLTQPGVGVGLFIVPAHCTVPDPSILHDGPLDTIGRLGLNPGFPGLP